MTMLGNKIARDSNGQTVEPQNGKTSLSRKLAGGKRGETVDVPGLGRVWLELVGANEWADIEALCFADLKARGLELTVLTAELYEMSRAKHTLALATREPERHGESFGTLEEWGQLDPSIINAAWQAYGDVKERLDPLSAPISEAERTAIELALKKKDATLLRSFGVTKLSAYLATTVDPPSSSPSPSSPSSES